MIIMFHYTKYIKLDSNTYCFQKVYKWPTYSDARVYEVWQRVASRHYSIKIGRLRNNKQGKPNCVPETVWAKWTAHWDTPEWRAKSETARKNRLSEVGGEGSGPSRHTGGSLSMMEHTLRMVKNNLFNVYKKFPFFQVCKHFLIE